MYSDIHIITQTLDFIPIKSLLQATPNLLFTGDFILGTIEIAIGHLENNVLSNA